MKEVFILLLIFLLSVVLITIGVYIYAGIGQALIFLGVGVFIITGIYTIIES